MKMQDAARISRKQNQLVKYAMKHAGADFGRLRLIDRPGAPTMTQMQSSYWPSWEWAMDILLNVQDVREC